MPEARRVGTARDEAGHVAARAGSRSCRRTCSSTRERIAAGSTDRLYDRRCRQPRSGSVLNPVRRASGSTGPSADPPFRQQTATTDDNGLTEEEAARRLARARAQRNRRGEPLVRDDRPRQPLHAPEHRPRRPRRRDGRARRAGRCALSRDRRRERGDRLRAGDPGEARARAARRARRDPMRGCSGRASRDSSGRRRWSSATWSCSSRATRSSPTATWSRRAPSDRRVDPDRRVGRRWRRGVGDAVLSGCVRSRGHRRATSQPRSAPTATPSGSPARRARSATRRRRSSAASTG